MQPINSNRRVFDHNCAICLEEISMSTRITVEKCHHIFHRTCLSTWKETSDTCPTCRGPLKTPVYASFFKTPLEFTLELLEGHPITHFNIEKFQSITKEALDAVESENHFNPSPTSNRLISFLRALNLINLLFQGPEQFKEDFARLVRQNPDVILDWESCQVIVRLRVEASIIIEIEEVEVPNLDPVLIRPHPDPALVLPQNPPQVRPPARRATLSEIVSFALLTFVLWRTCFIYGDLCNGRIVLSPAQKADRKFFAKVLFVDISTLP